MKRKITTIITVIAFVTLLVTGAVQELTAGSMITAGICCAWLGLVAFATTRSARHGR